MPSVVIKDIFLPDEVKIKLEDLDNDLKEGDVTTRGYCKKKWKILESHVSSTISEQIQSLQNKLEASKLSENDYCIEVMKILQLTQTSVEQKVSDTPANTIVEDEKAFDILDLSGENCNGQNNIPRKEKTKVCGPMSAKPKEVTNSASKLTTIKINKKSPLASSKNGSNEGILSQTTIESFFCAAMKREQKEGKTTENDVSEIEPFNDTKEEVKMEIEKRSVDNILEEKDDPVENFSLDQNTSEIQPEKKVKLAEDTIQTVTHISKTPKSIPSKCKICHQLLDDPDLHLYQGHPDEAVDEFIALTHPKLSLFTGEEDIINENDERPQNKLTCFSVYDKEGHLCPFDSGLVERNVLLYVSGYIKPIYEESSDCESGIPTKDLGPINEWWVSGFDGGELALIGFSTAYGEYYLMEPSEEYAPFMGAVREKIFLSKVVIEFLLDEVNPSYEDLLNKLVTTVPPNGLGSFTEDVLLKHAQFVCDQVMSFDAAAVADEGLLIVTSCMRSLINLSGVTFGKRRAMRRAERKGFKERKPKVEWSKATTTELVQDVFETFFTEQLDKDGDKEGKGPRRRRCGVCEACQQPDCGTCVLCKNMLKFGGTGKSKQACEKRRCPNMAIQEADDSDPEDEEDYRVLSEVASRSTSWKDSHKNICVRDSDRDIQWIGKSVIDDGRRTFYNSVSIANEEVKINDCVMVESSDATVPLFIARVIYMWQDQRKGHKYFHAQWFCRGSDTVIGETADPMELFLVDECEDCLMSTISRKAEVSFRAAPENWSMLGGEPLIHDQKGPDNDSKTFYYQKQYSLLYARFEDPFQAPPCKNKNTQHRFCAACERVYLQEKLNTPSIDEKLDQKDKHGDLYGVIRWKGEEFRVGTSVYLDPGTFKFKSSPPISIKKEKANPDKFDEDVYPEFYRKHSEHVGGNEETAEPFCIGFISAIINRGFDKLSTSSDIMIRVNKYYRPENTHRGTVLSQQMDLNKLYWSEEEKVVNFGDVVGKCNVLYSENLENITIDEWTRAGPHRFYFTQAYDSMSNNFEEPPPRATSLGKQGKGKGKGKGKSSKPKEASDVTKDAEKKLEEWPLIAKKLRSLDVFAGCGGLSEGLHQSGVAESHWAIELEESAANAFKLNNSHATVFTEDCNLLLKLAMNGENTNDRGQVLPKRGEVELLCGGPPCQGFSGMNRFNSRQYSLFKNSLIVSYLSYCDYYRPRFFILENVRNFVSFKNSIVLKLTLRCLLRMGYQCTFGVLQAGNYGVPQTRRRAIIIAAAPGEVLPKYPEPTHVFSRRGCQLSVVVDNKKYTTNCEWDISAPYRTITVRDSMSDLPAVRNGHSKEEMSYGGEPLSHFQRSIRGNQYQPFLRDHICKLMAPVTEARIANIPTAPGSDWRDLPNIVVRLNDGNYTKQLQYTHHDKKNGKSSNGTLRGVCACAAGKTCDPMDRQFNTLIPWCLPHTGNRHNNWAGLYGRLEWDGYFKTTVTNPEPMGKQGRVLHPEQTRVVTVRECARSQGFPDTYRFYGNILSKHRQVGNAVPPPMGAAIGLEIRKCVYAAEQKVSESLNNMDIDGDNLL